MLKDKFKNDAEDVYLTMQRWIMPFLRSGVQCRKDTVKTSGGMQSSTRKEQVSLPKFYGEDKMSPYLRYPIWKQEWELLIVEYEEKW